MLLLPLTGLLLISLGQLVASIGGARSLQRRRHVEAEAAGDGQLGALSRQPSKRTAHNIVCTAVATV